VLLSTASTTAGPALSGTGGAAIGTAQFAFGGKRVGTQNAFLMVDARNTGNPLSSVVNTPDILLNLAVVAPNFLYGLINNTGVAVYQIPQ
jgi:hypothetical protein